MLHGDDLPRAEPELEPELEPDVAEELEEVAEEIEGLDDVEEEEEEEGWAPSPLGSGGVPGGGATAFAEHLLQQRKELRLGSVHASAEASLVRVSPDAALLRCGNQLTPVDKKLRASEARSVVAWLGLTRVLLCRGTASLRGSFKSAILSPRAARRSRNSFEENGSKACRKRR